MKREQRRLAIWFSCGVSSAVAAKLALEYDHEAPVLYNPVAEEDPDNLRFLEDIQDWLGIKVKRVINPKWPTCSARDVWEKRKSMSFVYGAPCTYELKRKARFIWEDENPGHTPVLGFTADEQQRASDFLKTERDAFFPLIERGISKSDCFDILRNAGIATPKIYTTGLDHANCIGCVKATGIWSWQIIREHFPEVFKDRCEMSRRMGVRLTRYKGKRIFLDELPVSARGRPPKKSIDCGIFCEPERTNNA